MTSVTDLASTLRAFLLCQEILRQHQPMVYMYLSSLSMPVVAQIIPDVSEKVYKVNRA